MMGRKYYVLFMKTAKDILNCFSLFFFPLQLRRSGYSRMYICGFIAVSFIITIT